MTSSKEPAMTTPASETTEASDSPAPDPFSPFRLGPVTLRNRLVKSATFEGMAVDGLVSDRLVEFHRAFARGGVGMTTLAYLAVSPDGQGARPRSCWPPGRWPACGG
jgi:2,4-dienoyl-CoA reductase-like NADH-dependent reductase (Old Yellow Enzyme family)